MSDIAPADDAARRAQDADKLNQCVLIAKVLWFVPPPARAKFADTLYQFGIRLHPELATQSVMVGGVPGMGEFRPRIPVSNNARDQMALVRQWAPDLADKMDAATTEMHKQQILADIRSRYSQLVAEAEHKMATAVEEAQR